MPWLATPAQIRAPRRPYAREVENERTDHGADDPVRIVSTAVTAGIPPMMRAIRSIPRRLRILARAKDDRCGRAGRDRDGEPGEDAGERARDQRADDLRRASFSIRRCCDRRHRRDAVCTQSALPAISKRSR